MKLFSNLHARPRRTTVSAFTLVEVMVSVGIFLGLFVGVMVAIQIFGLRVYTLAATKLTATADGRKAMNQIRDDIRQAKTLSVGNLGTAGSPATFTNLSGANLAKGIALQIFPTTNSLPYTIYYLDTTTASGTAVNYLKAYTMSSSSVATTVILTKYITNSIIFDAEDFQGNPVTNNVQNNQVYGVTLQFYQWEYPIGYIGGVGFNAYDFYQLRTKICRRALD
jgi:type II secretory pathway pseudopilin PulG